LKDDAVILSRHDDVALITLNRPTRANAFDLHMLDQWVNALVKCRDDDHVKAIVVTGEGKSFCAGVDLAELDPEEKEYDFFKRLRSGAHRVAQEMFRVEKPIIAAINGYAVGGGFSLALSCHIRYCVPASKFGCSEVRWSHMAAWPSYVCQLPTGWAYWFALSGQMIDADTAFRLGLVQKICDPEKLMDDCIELATTINRNGRLIAAHTVEFIEDKLLYEIQGWEKGFEVHRDFYAHLRQSKDYDEGSAAFSERRKPEFSQEFYDAKTKPPGVPDPVK